MNSSLSLLPPSPSPRIKIHASSQQLRPRQGAVLFSARRWPGRAWPQQKRDPNTGPRSATYTHVPTPCKVAQPMDRAQHCQPPFVSLRSVHYWWSRQGLHQSPAPCPARTRDSTPLHSTAEGTGRSVQRRAHPPTRRSGRQATCMRRLLLLQPWAQALLAYASALCLPRSAGARLCAAACGHARPPPGGYATCKRAPGAGREGAGLPEPEAGAGVRARPPVRTPCARGGGSMRPVHHPIPSRNDADRARPSSSSSRTCMLHPHDKCVV